MYDNYYSIGTDDDPYSGRRLKNVKLIKILNCIQTNTLGNGFYVFAIEAMD
jgi:hypothetical protein